MHVHGSCKQEKWRSYVYVYIYSYGDLHIQYCLIRLGSIVFRQIEETCQPLTLPAKCINGSDTFTLAKISKFTSFAIITDVYLSMQKCLCYRVLWSPDSLMDRTPRFASFVDNTDVEYCFCDDLIRHKCIIHSMKLSAWLHYSNPVSKVSLKNMVDLTNLFQD